MLIPILMVCESNWMIFRFWVIIMSVKADIIFNVSQTYKTGQTIFGVFVAQRNKGDCICLAAVRWNCSSFVQVKKTIEYKKEYYYCAKKCIKSKINRTKHKTNKIHAKKANKTMSENDTELLLVLVLDDDDEFALYFCLKKTLYWVIFSQNVLQSWQNWLPKMQLLLNKDSRHM